ncbi:MAG: DEAD/DEAH box helicase family protein [Frankiaceae bacterium]
MRLQFDANQDFQVAAVESVLSLIEGQPVVAQAMRTLQEGLLDIEVSSNPPLLPDDVLARNLERVQDLNGLPRSELVEKRFEIEMETGTGKTYVYLRTIRELHRRYGFTKFVVVVPSVAIREGLLATVSLTREHFDDLYDRTPIDTTVYDGRRLAAIRSWATSTNLQLLVLTLDSFNKPAGNVIYQPQDSLGGNAAIDFLRAAAPVVVLDEPQNMESLASHEALRALGATFTLAYSATHREMRNAVYRLGPVEAFQLGLVKRIEVDAVVEEDDLNAPFVCVESVAVRGGRPSARLTIVVQGASGPSRRAVTVRKPGTDLRELSNGLDVYDGYVIAGIDAGAGTVELSNGLVLGVGESLGDRRDDIMRVQVRETVRQHLEKELRIRRLRPEGSRLKVLSLLFLDRVASYVGEGAPVRRWFDEAYEELRAQARYASLELPDVASVQGSYFARSATGPQDTSGTSQADNAAYELIMRDKQRLLQLDVPLRFIFSHSALREGWDNPNVFQICTLNETRSVLKKRQEIGRGLRLPVDENGVRCFDGEVNRLTIIANEAYDRFARTLQEELAAEAGVPQLPDGYLSRARERRELRLRPGWSTDPELLALWDRIRQRTRYAVRFETGAIIAAAADALAKAPRVTPPRIAVSRAELSPTEAGLDARVLSVSRSELDVRVDHLPDILSLLQRETELTRSTIVEALIASGRLKDFLVNPAELVQLAAAAFKRALQQVVLDGIVYEPIGDGAYELRLFEDRPVTGYASRMLDVGSSLTDAVIVESNVERDFAKALDARDDIKLFVKLPSWFQVPTPVGQYNPDWAIVKHPEGAEERLCLVRETKGTTDPAKLRDAERAKVRCGAAHFEAIGVDYAVCVSADEV